MTEPAQIIVLFDGVCNLCNRFVQFIIKRDPEGKFKFAALQSAVAAELLKDSGLAIDSIKSVVLIKSGNYYVKSKAVLHLLKELNGAWKFFSFLIVIPRPVRDFFYDVLARSRYRVFGKREVCMIPTDELKSRFLNSVP